RRLDRAGRGEIAGKHRGSLLKSGLALEQGVEFFLDLLLVEQLATHDPVDLRTQFSNTIFIGELHFRLSANQARKNIVTKSEVSAGRDRPHRHNDQRADYDPERDRSNTDLVSGVGKCVDVVSPVQVSR